MRWLWLLLGFGCGGGESQKVEICDNTLDDDLDGAADCADSDCAGSCPELCGDTLDNDGDGAADCADTDCDGSCPEQCDDGRDNDLDGLIDCADADCAGGCPELCDDGVDNDGDGEIDCADADCAGPACAEDCFNGRDDDGDGAADCADPDCDGSCPEDCTDGRDNDADGDIDCLDRDCDGACPEDCEDLRDNDGNGLVDCNDPVCLPVCDADRDGFLTADRGGPDCNDDDPRINPDANEVCNDLDDDCDLLVDGADPDLDPASRSLTWPDEDEDGFGAPGPSQLACPGRGRATNDDDCDDLEPAVNPAEAEVCDDLDNDCDRLVDDADPDVLPDDFLTFWRDFDADGLGNPAGPTQEACSTPPGFAPNDDDCDDRDPGLGGPTDWWVDADGDGFGEGDPVEFDLCEPVDPTLAPVSAGEDCDDRAPDVYPGAVEVCEDGVDQDCDGDDLTCRVDVEWPSSDSRLHTGGLLGGGGGGAYFVRGNYLEEQFSATGRSVMTGLDLDFDMSDLTNSFCPVGTLTWTVTVNGVEVGRYAWEGGRGLGTQEIRETFAFPPVAGTGVDGQTFVLRATANETVCPGGGSWNWLPGGRTGLL